MDELRAIAARVAASAAELVHRRRTEGVRVAASKSSIVDVVTDADREAEDLVRSMLADLRPTDGVLGEESGAASGTSGLTWVVDPIDGTVNYLYGIPHYAVSIAVVEGDPRPDTWRALAGCVHNAATGESFTAAAGAGATVGDRSLTVAPAVELEQALVGTGFGYTPEKRAEQGRTVAALLPRVRDIRRMGTASLDLCAVADGRLNAYFESGLQPWDHAAGALIAVEAGARVVGRGGVPADHRSIIAGPPEVVTRLEALLDEIAPLG